MRSSLLYEKSRIGGGGAIGGVIEAGLSGGETLVSLSGGGMQAFDITK
jgi:hypothetical protein